MLLFLMQNYNQLIIIRFIIFAEIYTIFAFMRKELMKHPVADHISDVVQVEMLSFTKTPEHSTKGYHQHNSLQIVMIEKGEVEFMVNCILHKVESGAVIMFGSDLPHGVATFSENIKATLLHIPYKSLYWCNDVPELHSQAEFIKKSRQGYLFSSSTLIKKIIRICNKLKKAEGFQRICYLFEVLHLLKNENNVKNLVADMEATTEMKTSIQQNSVERTFDYLYTHFQEEFRLEDVAAYASQNPAALCRAFKRRSGYTIFQFVNRLRIEKACQLLKNTELSVTEISFRVGFNTFSHFNTQFRKIIDLSPSAYRSKSNI